MRTSLSDLFEEYLISEILHRASISGSPTSALAVRSAGTSKPDYGKSKELFVFRTKKYKYIIEFEHYGDGIVTVSYKPKVGRDFGGKEGKNIYSYQTNDPEKFKVLTTVFNKMYQYTMEYPETCIVFYGSPDSEEVNDDDGRFNNSKRFRIYLTACNRIFPKETYTTVKDEPRSGVAVIPKYRVQKEPEIEGKVKAVLYQHF